MRFLRDKEARMHQPVILRNAVAGIMEPTKTSYELVVFMDRESTINNRKPRNVLFLCVFVVEC